MLLTRSTDNFVALRERVARLPGVQVELSTECRHVAQDPDGVTLDLQGPNGHRQVRARYVLACDVKWSGSEGR